MPTHLPTDRPLRWGILGCGAIARTFAADIPHARNQTLVAVASLTPGKAERFAADHHGVHVHQDYESLVRRADIDAVYVATTHERHQANAGLALAHGKAVLCEKPLTLNAGQAMQLMELARQRGVFLMEAWWTRFFPAIQALMTDLAQGGIGTVRMVQADFGVQHAWSADHRMVDPARAGGALLDLGVYPVSFAHLVYGSAPDAVHGVTRRTPQGTDAQSSMVLSFPSGGQSLLSCSLDVRTPHQARILGTNGSVVIDNFFHPAAYTIQVQGQAAERKEFPFPGSGYQFEMDEVATCLQEGRIESSRRSWADTIAVMRTMDTLRRAWGLRYPDEDQGSG